MEVGTTLIGSRGALAFGPALVYQSLYLFGLREIFLPPEWNVISEIQKSN